MLQLKRLIRKGDILRMEVAGKRSDIDAKPKHEETSLCESCEVENLKTPASGACRECKEKMCSTCFRHHLKGKLCRNHVLLSLEEFSSLKICSGTDVIRCKKHDNEMIKFYCRSHDVVGCSDCIVLGHTSCKPEYINDLAEAFKDGYTYKITAKRVEDLEKQTRDCEVKLYETKIEFVKMNEDVLKEIRYFRTEINKYLDDAENELLSELKRQKSENTVTLTKMETGLQNSTSELEKVKQMLDTQLHNQNVLFINTVNCKSKLADIEKIYTNMTQENELKGLKFVRNVHLASLLKGRQPLGSLQCKHTGHKTDRTRNKLFVGARVRPGPDSKWSHLAAIMKGTVISITDIYVEVRWDDGFLDGRYIIEDDNANFFEII